MTSEYFKSLSINTRCMRDETNQIFLYLQIKIFSTSLLINLHLFFVIDVSKKIIRMFHNYRKIYCKNQLRIFL